MSETTTLTGARYDTCTLRVEDDAYRGGGWVELCVCTDCGALVPDSYRDLHTSSHLPATAATAASDSAVAGG